MDGDGVGDAVDVVCAVEGVTSAAVAGVVAPGPAACVPLATGCAAAAQPATIPPRRPATANARAQREGIRRSRTARVCGSPGRGATGTSVSRPAQSGAVQRMLAAE